MILICFIYKNLSFQTDLTASGLANYKRRPSATHSKYPTPIVPNTSNSYTNNVSSKPVPQKRSESTDQRNSSKSNHHRGQSGSSSSAGSKSDGGGGNKKPKLPDLKPTFSTFKQFNRTASLSDLINEDDEIVVKPQVIQRSSGGKIQSNSSKNTTSKTTTTQQSSNQNHHSNKTTIRNHGQLDTESLASVNVNIPHPVLPPTKSITVQTDEALDLNLADFEIPNR